MKRVLIFLFLLGSFQLQAKADFSLRTFFLSLPDSIFTQFHCFSKLDSFPLAERKRMLTTYDSAISSFSSASGIRFRIRSMSDSLRRIVIDNLGESSITVQVLENGKNELFFSVSSETCDFVTCDQDWRFYIRNKKKISVVDHVLPSHFPMRLFFDPAYLTEMGIDPELDIDGITFYFEENSTELKAYLNTDYFDKELFGEAHPMVKLDPGKLLRGEIPLKRSGRKLLVAN